MNEHIIFPLTFYEEKNDQSEVEHQHFAPQNQTLKGELKTILKQACRLNER